MTKAPTKVVPTKVATEVLKKVKKLKVPKKVLT